MTENERKQRKREEKARRRKSRHHSRWIGFLTSSQQARLKMQDVTLTQMMTKQPHSLLFHQPQLREGTAQSPGTINQLLG